MNTYDKESISILSFREGVRSRIQMYLGSDDLEGTYQAFKEIINNATDEANAGFGDKIEITVDEELNVIKIRDYGRGVPFGIRESDGKNALIAVYTEGHAGAKFDDNDSYKNSSGLNGIGGSCVCLSSTEFRVISYRGGKLAVAMFKEGELFSYEETENYYADDKKHQVNPDGTEVTFSPDPKVFKNGAIGYEFKRICKEIKDISYLYPNITFKLQGRLKDGTTKEEEYHAEGGICDFVKDNIENEYTSTIIHQAVELNGDEMEIAFQWGSPREESYIFVNGLRCPEGGSPIPGARTAITKTFNSLAKTDFSGEVIRQNLFYVINCKVAAPSFANQTKSKINNESLRSMASTAFTAGIKELATTYPKDFDGLVDFLKRIEKAEKAAERAKDAILQSEKKIAETRKQKILMPDKFKDCEKHGLTSMLIICEGNSALSGLMPARNVDTEALYAIRGKIKNLLKHPLDECLDNNEVSDIIGLLGCGIQEKYNSGKLQYGKVAMAVDGDADGYSIMCLISTLFYILMPKFIEEKRLCWLRAPLYKLEKGKEKYFAYNDEELEELKKKYPQFKQTRIKGLGELTASDMEESMLHPENRRLEILVSSDIKESAKVFDLLMGKDVQSRKDYLFENADFSRVLL